MSERRFWGDMTEVKPGTGAWDIAPIRVIREPAPDGPIDVETKNGVVTHINLDGTVDRFGWADDPERVRMARVEAKRRIAIRNLKAAMLAPAEKVVGWLNRKLTR